MSTVPVNQDFENLLLYLKRTRGFDFTAYKRPGLMRRVQRRMEQVRIDGYVAYTDYLEVHPEEFGFLFDTILINVTAFFRDEPSWTYLAEEIVPRILETKNGGEPIRIWSAGCASGEEAYSLAMLMAERLGIEACRDRVKIYATDVDETALNKARLATYGASEVAGVPPAYLTKYFELNAEHYAFHKELRRSVIFGRHDLVQDAPISRIDLLVCRNVIMYFNAEAQGRVLARFYFAVTDTGYLFLGKAEMLLTHSNTFASVDLKRRVFRRIPRANARDRLLMMAQTGRDDNENSHVNNVRIREAAFDSDPLPQVVVDINGILVLASEKARGAFGLSFKDLGRPLRDLELSYRPADLRILVEKVFSERRAHTAKDVPWQPAAGDHRFLEIQLLPLTDPGGICGVKIIFVDVTRMKQLQDELQNSNQELETAYEEIQTSNEELQSTNEELETTNEELQSTNEELETMNEELQSANEELRTMNDEFQQRTEDLNQVNLFLESILGSLEGAVVVLNRDLQVEVWNAKSYDLWGLRAEETHGKYFFSLDIGLSVDRLKPAIKACLAGEAPVDGLALDATNRRGQAIHCKIACTPLRKPSKEIVGVIVIINEHKTDREPTPQSS
jgi:two-component system CheB/CheR fusion protein